MPTPETLTLTASDGHRLSAHAVLPDGPPRAGLVVIQEVFGVNNHIRALCEQFAGRGYLALAPALFDRVAPGIELGYGDEDLARGRALRTEIGWDLPVRDVAAGLAALAERLAAIEDAGQRVATIGYCWGGSVSWLAATRLAPAAAVCYYGAQIPDFRTEAASCPVLMHFGAEDPLIAPEQVEAVRAAQPDVEIHVHPGAGHGFNCTERADYAPAIAERALERTLAFLETHTG